MDRLRKELGCIKNVKFGLGGYQDAMIGVTFELGGKSWGVNSHNGAWSVPHTEHCKWTEEDRLRQLGEMVMYVNSLLTAAKVNNLADLAGVPVECTFDGNLLKSWRVLEEVIR